MKLFRISTILTLLIAAVFGVLLFWTSQDVQKQERELAKAKRALAQERETIRVLSVEWDYLNRPQRLEELASELGMKMPIAQEVMVGINEIPVPVKDSAENAIAQLQEEITQPVSEVTEEKTFEYPDYPKYVVPASISPAQAATPNVAYVPPSSPAQPKAEILSPSSAERNSFDRLIESLDTEGAH
jgi:hypothetical protein